MTGERGKPFGVQEIVNWIAWKWKRKWKDNRDRSAASVSTTPPSATGGNETELKEYLHQQRIARRMQYIQQQVKSTLHIRNNPHNVTTPSLTRLPDVLMQKLIHPTTVTPNDEIYPEIPEGEPRRRQVVLLPEEGESDFVYFQLLNFESPLF